MPIVDDKLKLVQNAATFEGIVNTLYNHPGTGTKFFKDDLTWDTVPNPDATYTVVAASNSSDRMKSNADYKCSGTNDDLKIMEALDDFGLVKLSMGTFNITGTTTIPEHGVLSGAGRGKTIILQSKSSTIGRSPIIHMSEYSTCENLTVNGNSWTDQDLDTDGIKLKDWSLLQNCEVLEPRQYAVYMPGSTGAKAINNIVHHTKYPLIMRAVSDNNVPWTERCMMYGNITHTTNFYVKLRGSRNCFFNNNICYINDVSAYGYTPASQGGIEFTGTDDPYENLQISNNMIVDISQTGITTGIKVLSDLEEPSNNVTISNNFITGFYYGIHGGCKDLLIQNNTIHNCRHSGVYMKGCDYPTVKNNKLYHCGILAQDSNYALIDGNVVNGEMVATHSQQPDGISVSCYRDAQCTGNNLINNRIYNCTIGSGIRITNTLGKMPNTTLIKNNNLYNNLYSIVDESNGPTTITGNDGYVTEKTGIATIAASASYVTVTHSMAATPTKIVVTPFGNVGNCWISSPGTTTFRINVSSAPASNTLISWSAEI